MAGSLSGLLFLHTFLSLFRQCLKKGLFLDRLTLPLVRNGLNHLLFDINDKIRSNIFEKHKRCLKKIYRGLQYRNDMADLMALLMPNILIKFVYFFFFNK